MPRPRTTCVRPDRRQWGWAAQLYSLRSETDSGVGDLASLRTLSEWSAAQGASFVLVSPLHALAPGSESPYYPTSRCFRDINCLAGPASDSARDGLVDRGSARALKLSHIGAAAAEAPRSTARAEFIDEHGELLRGFAAFEVLAAKLGWDHREWPEELQKSPRTAAERVWADAPEDAAVSCFIQWQVDVALQDVASTGCALVNDIAVGVDPGGFDAWWWQEGVVPGMSVGAPPDGFNADGQDWGVAVFDPDWLRTVEDGPLERAWTVAGRHAAGLRIDHVMGLSRLFWVPVGGGTASGRYVTYPLDDLLQKLVAVSRNTRTWIVGEDLGTVEEGLRPRLAAVDILSTKVIRFEQDPPAVWPELALGTASTHDLPPLSQGVDEAHRALAESPCLVVAATLEDTLGVTEPPNRPGIDDARNWRQSLPVTVEELVRHPRLQTTADLMHLRSRP
ncbi:MAG: 4-alpha-glucanotransferase [Actinobacteria bacterium]|nr:4-alpha-glucanotransferase [Actinomycetota bacterium]